MVNYEFLLDGGDLRSTGKSNEVVSCIKTQRDFDKLFDCLYHHNRLVVMRAADAIEKITIPKPEYLIPHKIDVLNLCHHAQNKELIWHLAQLLPRLNLTVSELTKVWNILINWSLNTRNSRIVRVNAIQSLYELTKNNKTFTNKYIGILQSVESENIPSLNARIKKLRLLIG
ncbi:MAG: hypothetical protein IPL55_21260 [Saprospiraceae bacterium]|jgi:hypothetical protein|nr:hypothetical protein [Saprospiraceae bacterium]